MARRPDVAILRISLPMGISSNGHAGAIDWIQSRFAKHRPATLFYDEVRTPTYTDCLNRLCEVMLANQVAGIFHAGGPRRLTLHQIAQIVNRVGGYDPRLLIGCLRSQAAPIPPRAGDVSMCSQKLIATLGYDAFDPWPLDDAFVPTHPHWHFDRPASEGGSRELLAEILYRNPARRRFDAA
jgi:dTDP-4-dehydrorhamnose reductase